MDINTILEQDLLARNNVEVRENDLIAIEELSAKEWDFSHCTLLSNKSCDQYELDNSSESIIKKFLERYPLFCDVDMSNILIAGGSVVNAVTGYDITTDVDLFIYGIPLEQVSARIEKLCEELFRDESGHIKKTSFATTFITSNCMIQVVHRLYNTVSEVLHGFDLGCCSVGILLDQNKVVTTSLGKVSLEYRINILDLSKRSLNYEFRLQKYLHRGFRLILPDFDVTKIRSVNGRYFTIHINNVNIIPSFVEGNNIRCNFLTYPTTLTSDYDTLGCNEADIAMINIIKVFHNKPLVYFKQWKNLSELKQCLNDHIVEFREDNYIKPFFDSVKNMYERLTKFMPSYAAIEWIDRMYKAVNNGKELVRIEAELKRYYVRKAKKLFEEYNSSGGYKAKWITVDPSSQITGSFHPNVVSKEEFYGHYLKM